MQDFEETQEETVAMSAGEVIAFSATFAMAMAAIWLLAFQIMPAPFQAIQLANGLTALIVAPQVLRSFYDKGDGIGMVISGFGFSLAALLSFYLALKPIIAFA